MGILIAVNKFLSIELQNSWEDEKMKRFHEGDEFKLLLVWLSLHEAPFNMLCVNLMLKP